MLQRLPAAAGAQAGLAAPGEGVELAAWAADPPHELRQWWREGEGAWSVVEEAVKRSLVARFAGVGHPAYCPARGAQ